MIFFLKFSEYLTLFSAGLLLLICLMELSRKHGEKLSNLFKYCFLLSILHFNFGLFIQGDYVLKIINIPIFAISIPIILFALGPYSIQLFYSITYFISGKKLSYRHFVPFVPGMVSGILFLFMDTKYQQELLYSFFVQKSFNIIGIIILLSIIHIDCYFFYLLFLFRKFNIKYRISNSKSYYMLIIFIIMGTVLLEAGFYLEEMIIFSLGADIISVSIILAILFSGLSRFMGKEVLKM